ncbi:MAG: dTDP-4-dehydrorhamnose 3,5-epimerase [Ruminococcaceae bacterium]|nr:dTDP-4-dehydrorhamnose 3,5-epimerase [Oscillospiraceae bacterium]
MKIIDTGLADVKLIEPDVFGDNRGWFYEAYSCEKLKKLGIDVTFVQDNRSYSKEKGTLRGIHFQKTPMAQSKLISCTRGKILDIAVDLRKGSPTYLKWISAELSEDNKHMLFIPKGFGHGFVTLTENVEVLYKVDEYYSGEHDRSIRYDDKEIGVEWPVSEPVLSKKDKNAPFLCESDVDFVWSESK